MVLLESPAVSDGVAAWQAWLDRLNTLSPKFSRDRSVAEEKERAEKMIRMFTLFPNGVDVKNPREFKAAMKQVFG
ncbi:MULTISPECIES: hypothetical protein [unclassified Duganella]|uniref:hypothetical protein n=1 Tax=unclassified Duganella TaxID=2636909 RepID=UPI0011137A1A|nr:MULTISPECIES: hypothetical protein [unclassified Duganella]